MSILLLLQMALSSKVGNKYYRAISGSEPDSYLLEQIKLYKSDVELVEVKK